MRKLVRYFLLLILVIFVGIQFFQPNKNQVEMSNMHLYKQEKIPENMQKLLNNACLDCHSNSTNYKWFHTIAPVSWMISKHIEEGKEELNLAEWGEMDVFEKIKNLEQICRETERQRMPLKSYSAIHKEARLTEQQITELCEWTTRLSEELLAKAVEN